MVRKELSRREKQWKKRKLARSLHMEGLEARTVMTMNAQVLAGGILDITLDANNDTATIQKVGTNIQVSGTGTAQTFSASSIQGFQAKSLSGVDQALTLGPGLSFSGSTLVDKIDTVTFQAGAHQASSVQISNAESIIASGVTMTATSDISFTALVNRSTITNNSLGIGSSATASASVSLTNSVLNGINITLSAQGTIDVNAESDSAEDSNRDLSRLVLNNSAIVSILGTTQLNASGNVVVSARTNTIGSATAEAKSTSTSATTDAAVAISNLTSLTRAVVDGTSRIVAGGNLRIVAETNNQSIAVADGSLNGVKANGGSVAINKLDETNEAIVNAATQLTAGNIEILATSITNLQATAKSTIGGANANDASTQQELASNNASNADGSISSASAFSLNKFNRRLNRASVSGASLTSPGAIHIGGSVSTNSVSSADASATGSGTAAPIGAGVAVALGLGTSENLAILSGAATLNTPTLLVDALTPSQNTFSATAKSGAGTTSVGIAGAFAIESIDQTSAAFIPTASNIGLTNTNLTIQASNTTLNSARSEPLQSATNAKRGIGASYAQNSPTHVTRAEIEGLSPITGAKGLVVNANAAHSVNTNVIVGAQGGSAVDAAVGINVAHLPTTARIGELDGSTTTTGSVSVSATANNTHTLTVNGSVVGNSFAVGASIGINDVTEAAEADVDRSMNIAGDLSIQARADAASDVQTKASRAGISQSSSTSTTTNAQVDRHRTIGDRPGGDTKDGPLAGAAALAVNVDRVRSTARIGNQLNIAASGRVDVISQGKSSVKSNADASSVNQPNSTSTQNNLAIAASLNRPDVKYEALVDVNSGVQAQGLNIQAKMPAAADEHQFQSESVSGAASKNIGFAGSVAINAIRDNSSATVEKSTLVHSNEGTLQIQATSQSRTTTKARPRDGGTTGSTLGVGTSAAMTFADHSTIAASDPQARALGSKLEIAARSSHHTTTEATGGAGAVDSTNSAAVTPVVALAGVDHTTIARLGSQGNSSSVIGGDIQIQSSHEGFTSTRAVGDANSSGAGIGFSLALGLGSDQVQASIGTATASGNVNVQAQDRGLRASESRASVKGSESSPIQTVNSRVDSHRQFVNGKTGDTNAPAPALTNSIGTMQSAGAIAVQLSQASTQALVLPNSQLVAQGKLSLLTADDMDGRAKADASAVGLKSTAGLGIGGAAAVNRMLAVSSASISANANVQAHGIDIKTQMLTAPTTSLIPAETSGIANASAESISGAGLTAVGIAGSFALNIAEYGSEAKIASGAIVDAGEFATLDDVALQSTSKTNVRADAKAAVTAQANTSKVGVGPSLAYNVDRSHGAASIDANVSLQGADDLSVEAISDRTGNAASQAGSQGNISVAPGVAVDVDSTSSSARIAAGPAMLLDGNVAVRTSHVTRANSQAQANADGNKVAVGTIVPVTVQVSESVSTVERNMTTTGDIRSTANSDFSATSEATATAVGANLSNIKQDDLVKQIKDEAQNLIAKDTGEDFKTRLSNSIAKVAGPISEQLDKATDQVAVAAAIGVNISKTKSESSVPAGVVLQAGGNVGIESFNRNVANARSVGASVSAGAVGVATAVNVLDPINRAAFQGASIQGTDISIQANVPAGQTNSLVAQAASAAGGAQNSVGIGSLSLNIGNEITEATVAAGAVLNATSDLSIQAGQSVRPQALAGGIALARAEGTGVALAGNIINDSTTAKALSTSLAPTQLLSGNSLKIQASHDLQPFNSPSPIDPLSFAVGGTATADNSKVGSLSADIIVTTTVAETGVGAVLKQTGLPPTNLPGVTINASDTTQVLSGAGAITVSDAKGKNFGAQLEVLTKETRAVVGQGASIQAIGRSDVLATSDEKMTTFAGALGVTNANNLGGTAVVLIPNVTTLAQTQNATNIQSNGGMNVLATHTSDLKPTAGTLGLSNERSIGTAVVVTVDSDRTEAMIGGNSSVSVGGPGLKVASNHTQNLRPIAIGGALAGGNTFAGSSTVSVLNTASRGHIDIGSSVAASDPGVATPSIQVSSSNLQSVQGGQGNLSIGTNGFGAGADVLRLNSSSLAWVEEGTQLQAERDIVVDAKSNERTIAISGSANVASSAAIGGGATVQNVDINTQALLGRNPQVQAPGLQSSMVANGNVVVSSNDVHDADLIAVTAGAGGNGAGGAVAAVASVSKVVRAEIAGTATVDALANGPATNALSGAFNVTTPLDVPGDTEVALPPLGSLDTTLQFDKSRFGKDRLATPVQSGVRGVRVTATQQEKMETVAVGGSASSITVNLAAPVHVIQSDVNAAISSGAVVNGNGTGNALQNVEVLSGSDVHLLEVSGGVGVAGTASIVPGAAVSVIRANTSSLVGNGAVVRATRDVEVTAKAKEDVFAVTAGVGVAGTVGVVGAAAVTTINNNTLARVGTNASVFAGEDVLIQSTDDSQVQQVNGAIAVGVGIVGVGGAVGVIRIQKETDAIIDDNALVDAVGGVPTAAARAGGVTVQSRSSEDVDNITASGGGGFIGVAGSVNSLVIDSDTHSRVDPGAKLNTRVAAANPGQAVRVLSENQIDVLSIAGAIAAGVGTGAGGVDVGTIRNDTSSLVDANTDVRARADIQIDAKTTKNVRTTAASGGLGVAGLAGSVSVWSIGTKLDPNYSNAPNEGSTGTIANALADDPADGGGAPQDEFADKFAHRQIEKVRDRLLLNLNAYGKPAVGDTTPNGNQRIGVESLSVRTEVSQSLPTQATLDANLADQEQNLASVVPTGTAAIARPGSSLNSANGGVTIKATDLMSVETKVGQAAFGLVSLGASVDVLKVAQKTTALLEGKAEGAGAIQVVAVGKGGPAQDEAKIRGTAAAGQLGLVGLGAAVVAISDTSNHQASLASTGSIERAASVLIASDAARDLSGTSKQALINGLSVGASFVRIEDLSTASATSNGKIGQAVNKNVGSLSIQSDNISQGAVEVDSLAGGIGAGSANFSRLPLKPRSIAHIGSGADTKVRGSVVVDANAVAYIGGRATDGTLLEGVQIDGVDAGGATIGGSQANTSVVPFSEAQISNANIQAGVDLIVRSTADGLNVASVDGSAGAISGTFLSNTVNTNLFADANARIVTGTENNRSISVGRDVIIDASADSQGSAVVGNQSGSLFTSIGRANANNTQFSEASAGVSGDGLTTIQAGRNVQILSRTSQRGNAEADSFGVAIAPDAKATANSDVDFSSTVGVGNAQITAANQIQLDAGSHLLGVPNSLGTVSKARGTARGVGGGSDSDAIANANVGVFSNTVNGSASGPGAQVKVDVPRGSQLQAKRVDISAHGGNALGSAKADPFDTGLFVSPDATARARMSPKALVNIGSTGVGTAAIRGDDAITINASWNGLMTDANAIANDTGGTVASNAVAVNTQTPTIDIVTNTSSTFATRDLDVDVKVVPLTYQVLAQRDSSGGPETLPTVRNFNPLRTIHWDGDVRILAQPNPVLEVNSSGVVTKAENIAIVDTDNNTLGPVVAPQIVVQNISHTPNLQPIHWEANALIPTAGSSLSSIVRTATGLTPVNGQPVFPGSILGFNTNVEYQHSLQEVVINNASSKDVVLANINPIATHQPEAIIEGLGEDNFNFNVSHAFQPTNIAVNNTSSTGTPDIVLRGSIQNPIGATQLSTSRGDIFSAIPRHLVQTHSAELSAPGGSIGEVGDPIVLELVQDSALPTTISVDANGDARLQLSGRLRSQGVSPAVPSIDANIQVNGLADIQLGTHHADLIEGQPLSSTVREVRPPLADKVTTVFTRFHVPVEETLPNPPLAIFGTGSVPVAGKVRFLSAEAGSFNLTDSDLLRDTISGAVSVTNAGSATISNVDSNGLALVGGSGNNTISLTNWGGTATVDGGLGVDSLRLQDMAGSVTTLESMRLVGPLSTRATAPSSIAGSLEMVGIIGVNVADTTQVRDLLVTATLTGDGALRKSGTGHLVLTSNSTNFNGVLASTGGSIFTHGSMPQATVQSSGGSFFSDGIVKSIVPAGKPSILGAGDELAPVGKLTVNGPFQPGAASTLQYQLNGLTAGTTYDTIVVNGSVDLGGSTLNTSLGFASAVGNIFTLINNDGTDAIVGTFAGLPQGATLTVNGVLMQISYSGGSGNDVTLTRVNSASAFAQRTVTPILNEDGVAILRGKIVEADPLDSFRLLINWGDGTIEEKLFPAGTVDVELSHRYLDDPANGTEYRIDLDWRDPQGGGRSDFLSTTVQNVAPSVSIGGDSNGVRGQNLEFTLNAIDPSLIDTISGFDYEIHWGDGGVQRVDGQATQIVRHTYTRTGNFTVQVTATDKDGGVSTIASRNVRIDAVQLANGILRVGGTTGDDRIELVPFDKQGSIAILSGGEPLGIFQPTGQIEIYGQAGNDQLVLKRAILGGERVSISNPVFLFGGDGEDLLDAAYAAGSVVMVGGSGDDELIGGANRDIVIGGAGQDRIRTTSGNQDILIGEGTIHDRNVNALSLLLAEWVRTDNGKPGRIQHLMNGGGLNGAATLSDSSLIDDGLQDELLGDLAGDWFR